MLLIPLRLPAGHPRGPVVLFMLLEAENLERMKAADPVDLQLRSIPGSLMDVPWKDLDLVIAFIDENDKAKILALQNDINGIVVYLERGRKIQEGDLMPPRSIRSSKQH